MIEVRLGADLRQVAVASPDYLARHCTPRVPADVIGHRCLTFRWPGRDAIYDWKFARNDGDCFSLAVTGPLVLFAADAAWPCSQARSKTTTAGFPRAHVSSPDFITGYKHRGDADR